MHISGLYQIGAPENEGAPVRVPTQEELMGEDSKRLLRQGIDLPKVKAALKDLLLMLRVDIALSGEPRRIQIHWSIHGPLRNWLRAEFPALEVMAWPWGNWWEVRATTYPKMGEKPEVKIFRLVIPVNGVPR